MTTVTLIQFDHGLTFAADGRLVYPVTPCCRRGVDWSGECSGSRCYRRFPESYALAAISGSRYFRRDLRQILEDLTPCDQLTQCVDNLIERLAGT